MLFRKIEKEIEDHLLSKSNVIMIVEGARQVGKTFIIRKVGKKIFKNFIEVNLLDDLNSYKNWSTIRTREDFYLQLSSFAGDLMGNKEDTLVFLDEIQAYPNMLTLLKFLREDDKFAYIASGSLLGVTLRRTTSIPIGSITRTTMYPLDFEEFLLANGCNGFFVDSLREKFLSGTALDESIHSRVMDLFRKYLLVGGLPASVNEYLIDKNIQKVRKIQSDIRSLYSEDCSKYDFENKLHIKMIYELLPSYMENKKKRVIFKDVENKIDARYNNYINDFDYLVNSGVALSVHAISNPSFPLIESCSKNLFKLYYNDVGLLSEVLYKNNIRAILDDTMGINLGSVYETVVATELASHGHELKYYDNREKGEVDYLINDYDSGKVIPIEIKSGKNYPRHRAISNLVMSKNPFIEKGYVFSNDREVSEESGITYYPIYYIMFV